MGQSTFNITIGGSSTSGSVGLPPGAQGTGIRLQDYSVQAVVQNWSGAVAIDADDGNTYQGTLTGDVTSMSLSGWPASGEEGKVTLYVKQTSPARTVSWPAGVKWVGGLSPQISTIADEVDVIVFTTVDGGTTVYGFYVGRAS